MRYKKLNYDVLRWRHHIKQAIRKKSSRDKSGRLFVTRSTHPRLFKILDKIHIFDFYVGNKNKSMLGVSQIVAYLHVGYKAFMNGFTAEGLEVHHKNSVVDDNRHNNLIYLSRQDHLIVSHSTNTEFFNRLETEEPTPFNNQGRAIKNSIDFLVNVIRDTLIAVSKSRSGLDITIESVKILLDLPRCIHKLKVTSYFPRWFTRTILQNISIKSIKLV